MQISTITKEISFKVHLNLYYSRKQTLIVRNLFSEQVEIWTLTKTNIYLGT